MNVLNFLRTQWVLRKKRLFNHFSSNQSENYQRFVILCDPRSGSTWLHTLLNSSAQIQSYGEILTERNITDGLKQTIWQAHHSAIRAVGCKIFYEQLQMPEFEKVFQEICVDRSIKIIDLKRENDHERFVSFQLAERTNVWSSTRSKIADSERITIDEGEFIEFCDISKRRRAMILEKLSDHEIHPITYEELLNDFTGTLDRLQQFIGVVPRPLFSLLKKQSNVSGTT